MSKQSGAGAQEQRLVDEKIWSRDFVFMILANFFIFLGFHDKSFGRPFFFRPLKSCYHIPIYPFNAS